MVKTALAFEFSKTRTICDAFDEAWALLQGLGSDLTQAPKSLATQTILAKRIIEMADQGLRNIPELRDDALAFLQHSPRSGGRNGLGGAIGAQAAALAELSRPGALARRLCQPQPAHITRQAWARAARERRTQSSGRFSFGFRAGTRGARGALDGVVGIGARREGSAQHGDHSANARA